MWVLLLLEMIKRWDWLLLAYRRNVINFKRVFKSSITHARLEFISDLCWVEVIDWCLHLQRHVPWCNNQWIQFVFTIKWVMVLISWSELGIKRSLTHRRRSIHVFVLSIQCQIFMYLGRKQLLKLWICVSRIIWCCCIVIIHSWFRNWAA